MEGGCEDMSLVFQQLISGVAMGCIYALVALGYTFIWNAVGIVNLAQGDFVTLAAFIYGISLVNHLGWPFVLALLGVLAAMALFGAGVEKVVYYPLRTAHPRTVMLSTLALSILMANLVLIIWGPYPLSTTGPFGHRLLVMGNVSIPYQNIFIIIVGVLLLFLQNFFFTRTSMGKVMRAVAQNQEAATLMGIETSKVIAFTFAYSSAIAGVAGVLIAPVFMISTDLGAVGLKGFASSVIGGFGQVFGAAFGGIFLGIMEVLAASYISSLYKDAIVFLILILFLLLRPQGFFGRKGSESL
ncbi:MAG: branched-chain amino acid ABC transporter permease [Limnochordia bacterium]|jgi:branched-chain amino acid transport system permease protein